MSPEENEFIKHTDKCGLKWSFMGDYFLVNRKQIGFNDYCVEIERIFPPLMWTYSDEGDLKFMSQEMHQEIERFL